MDAGRHGKNTVLSFSCHFMLNIHFRPTRASCPTQPGLSDLPSYAAGMCLQAGLVPPEPSKRAVPARCQPCPAEQCCPPGLARSCTLGVKVSNKCVHQGGGTAAPRAGRARELQGWGAGSRGRAWASAEPPGATWAKSWAATLTAARAAGLHSWNSGLQHTPASLCL